MIKAKMKKQGKFIVLEGIDGAGCGAQREAVSQKLQELGHKVKTVEFPDHDFAIYQSLVHPYIHGEIKLAKDEAFLLFAADQMRYREEIKRFRKKGIFIADRYFTTNLVYNCNNEFSLKDGSELAKKLKIAVPDLVIFLDVSPKVAMERKLKEDGHEHGLDLAEKDIKKQGKIYSRYQKLIKDKVFAPWVVVDGEKTIEEVRDEVIKCIFGVK